MVFVLMNGKEQIVHNVREVNRMALTLSGFHKSVNRHSWAVLRTVFDPLRKTNWFREWVTLKVWSGQMYLERHSVELHEGPKSKAQLHLLPWTPTLLKSLAPHGHPPPSSGHSYRGSWTHASSSPMLTNPCVYNKQTASSCEISFTRQIENDSEVVSSNRRAALTPKRLSVCFSPSRGTPAQMAPSLGGPASGSVALGLSDQSLWCLRGAPCPALLADSWLTTHRPSHSNNQPSFSHTLSLSLPKTTTAHKAENGGI